MWPVGRSRQETVTSAEAGSDDRGVLKLSVEVPVRVPVLTVGPRPAVALTGPFTGVKEQVVGTYAERLAQAGFVTLGFDHRDFVLAGRSEVDPARIGVVGVCLGGGYAVRAATADSRVKAVAGCRRVSGLDGEMSISSAMIRRYDGPGHRGRPRTSPRRTR